VLVVAVAVFYFAYFAYYSPYRAMFADLIHPDFAGRAQSSQMIFREIGLGGALMGGGLLMQVWQPLPFLLSALVLGIVTAVAYFGFRTRYRDQAERLSRAAADAESAGSRGPALRDSVRAIVDLIARHRDIRRLLVANALWEFALGGLKTFVILFIVAGIGHSVGTASLLMGIVAVTAVVSAPIAGALADRYGIGRVMRIALIVYGVGLLLPLLSYSLRVIVPVLPIVGFGGGLAMSLPYGLLMRLMPEREHGAAAGLFEFSRGLGTTLGPLVTGTVIDWAQKPFASTHGYAAMWPVAGLAILASVPFTPDDRARGHIANS
jgi:Na+/melibiose symporter-like transporter